VAEMLLLAAVIYMSQKRVAEVLAFHIQMMMSLKSLWDTRAIGDLIF